MVTKRWQDWINLALGAWLLLSPAVLGFADNGGYAARSAYAFGALIVVFAGVAAYVPKLWEETVNLVLGLALFVSPWVIGYASNTAATRNAAVLGMLVTSFALSAVTLDVYMGKKWHDRHSH